MPSGALYISNTGLQAASRYLDVTSNNIANTNTTGFKTSQITFQDLLYTEFLPSPSVQGLSAPSGNQLGFGTVVDSVAGLFTQGPLNQTGGQFDLAINGRGLFAVTLSDGTTGYTRAGNFNINANGQLITADGFFLVPAITIPANATSVSVSADGTVTATTPDGLQQLGQIQLTDFQNPGGLIRFGNNLFTPGPGAGIATTGTPGTGSLGTLSQGFLEQSNVELVTELINLIVAQRTFTFNTQAIQVENATLQATLDLIQ
jgi:flagellar basal-body rod protein FlgG